MHLKKIRAFFFQFIFIRRYIVFFLSAFGVVPLILAPFAKGVLLFQFEGVKAQLKFIRNMTLLWFFYSTRLNKYTNVLIKRRNQNFQINSQKCSGWIARLYIHNKFILISSKDWIGKLYESERIFCALIIVAAAKPPEKEADWRVQCPMLPVSVMQYD